MRGLGGSVCAGVGAVALSCVTYYCRGRDGVAEAEGLGLMKFSGIISVCALNMSTTCPSAAAVASVVHANASLVGCWDFVAKAILLHKVVQCFQLAVPHPVTALSSSAWHGRNQNHQQRHS